MQLKNREEYDNLKPYFTKENCPFCTKLDKNKIIFESDFWYVKKNDFPYFNDINGLIAIPKRHIEFTVNLTKEEFADFLQVEKFMKDFFKDLGEYFSFIRQSKSNKSVEHMHYHYLV
jgi:diadenosine tetraphosphate (Ap4A) HIT family hydrolase